MEVVEVATEKDFLSCYRRADTVAIMLERTDVLDAEIEEAIGFFPHWEEPFLKWQALKADYGLIVISHHGQDCLIAGGNIKWDVLFVARKHLQIAKEFGISTFFMRLCSDRIGEELLEMVRESANE